MIDLLVPWHDATSKNWAHQLAPAVRAPALLWRQKSCPAGLMANVTGVFGKCCCCGGLNSRIGPCCAHGSNFCRRGLTVDSPKVLSTPERRLGRVDLLLLDPQHQHQHQRLLDHFPHAHLVLDGSDTFLMIIVVVSTVVSTPDALQGCLEAEMQSPCDKAKLTTCC